MPTITLRANHDLHAIFGPRPIHRLPFQNSTRQLGKFMYMHAKIEKEIDSISKHNFTNWCMCVCMYACKKRKGNVGIVVHG